MKLITGSPARGERFFNRSDIRQIILKAVSNEENLLISAPRRVGKSSILLDLVDNPDENFYAVFQDTEAIDDGEMFFKIITQAILNADQIDGFGYFDGKIRKALHDWTSRFAGLTIAGVGVKFEKGEKPTYYEYLNKFLSDIKLESKKILLLIDEFPITVEKIEEKQGTEAAQHFLSQNRALRQNPLFQEKIKFVYTGSIGLFTAVKKINATDKINDLREIKIPSLKKEDAIYLLNELISEECNLKLDGKTTDYILEKVEWWIPFYFQLLVREISDLLVENHELNKATIDAAFINAAANGNIYFQHFKSRLLKIFKNGTEQKFVEELLMKIKRDNIIDYNVILDLANNAGILDIIGDILEILKHDGYLVEENNQFRFYSPILKLWWK